MVENCVIKSETRVEMEKKSKDEKLGKGFVGELVGEKRKRGRRRRKQRGGSVLSCLR